MKIAFFTDTYYPQLNGVTTSVDNLAKGLKKQGHKVIVFAPKLNGQADTSKNIKRISSLKVLSSEPEVRIPFALPHRMLKEIISQDFDIVHAHGNGAFSLLGLQIARMKKVPYVLTFHTMFTEYTHYVLKGYVVSSNMISRALRVYGNMCDGIIVPSSKMKNELVKYGIKKPVTVIANFVNLQDFESAKKGYLRNIFNLPPDAVITLTVGRLGKEKNFSFVIKAFQKVVQNNPSAHLVIVGYGPERENLEKLAASLDISSNVHFAGKVDQEIMPQVYADASLFAFASTTETQGVCVLEAAASSLPILTVKDAAFANMVVDKLNGYLLPLNTDEFAKKISVLTHSKDLREKLGRNSQKVVHKNFQPVTLTDETIVLYEKLRKNYSVKRSPRRAIYISRVMWRKLINASTTIEKFFQI